MASFAAQSLDKVAETLDTHSHDKIDVIPSLSISVTREEFASILDTLVEPIITSYLKVLGGNRVRVRLNLL